MLVYGGEVIEGPLIVLNLASVGRMWSQREMAYGQSGRIEGCGVPCDLKIAKSRLWVGWSVLHMSILEGLGYS